MTSRAHCSHIAVFYSVVFRVGWLTKIEVIPILLTDRIDKSSLEALKTLLEWCGTDVDIDTIISSIGILIYMQNEIVEIERLHC